MEQITTPTSTTDPLALPDVETLDDARLDRLGTHLAVTAAADVASGRATAADRRPRRLVGGVVVAGLLGAGLFATNAIVGGPGPAAVNAAVAIERSDGWTTIEVIDPQASPAEIEEALEDAGLDARVEVIDSTPDGDGNVFIEDLGMAFDPLEQDGSDRTWVAGSFGADRYAVATFGSSGPGELMALGVAFDPIEDLENHTRITITDPDGGATDGAVDAPDDHDLYTAGYLDALEDRGIRAGGTAEDASKVSIQDGADVEVVLYVLG